MLYVSSLRKAAPLLISATVMLAGSGTLASADSSQRRASQSAAAQHRSIRKTSWTTWGYDAARTGYNPFEAIINPRTARSLHQRWAFNTGTFINTQPTVATDVVLRIHHVRTRADLVFVGNEHGGFYAINAATGRRVWKRNLGFALSACADIPDHHFGVTSAPVIDRSSNTIFVAGGNGFLYRLDLSTGTTQRGWPVRITGDPGHEHIWSSLTRSTDGAIYVAVASDCDIVPYHGRITKVRIASHQIVARWSPIPGNVSGGAIWGWGGVSVDHAGHVFTATGNVFTPNEHAFLAEHVVRLTGNLVVQASNFVAQIKGDDDFASAPMLYQAPRCPPQLAVMQKHGWLYVYNRNAIGSGPMQTLHMDATHEFIGGPAWDPVSHLVYVTHAHDSFTHRFVNGIQALRVGRHCQLSLAWQRRSPHTGVASAPTVAGGVVYYGNGVGQRLLAYNARTGRPVWNSGTTLGGPMFAAPTVANGSLYAAAWDGRLHAFSPRK
jgi:outer membrane protein assembly factor BamB